MRVLIATGIYPPETGGPATIVPALAAAWTERGWTVTVVTYGDETTRCGDRWRVSVVSRAGGVLVRYARYAFRVWKMARTSEVVFLQGPMSDGLPGTLGAWLAGRPTVLRVPGDFVWERMQRAQSAIPLALEDFLVARKSVVWRTAFWLESLVARRAKHVVTPSQYLQRLADAWGVLPERKKVIYNTVQLESALPARAELRAEFGLKDGEIVLLANARGVPWKRIDFLLEVLRDLPSHYVLLHIGEGPEVADWKVYAEKLNVTDRVRFVGRVTYLEVQRWARAADVFLLPSLYEGFPHVAIEAACQGLPCFLSDQGGNPEAADVYPERIKILRYADHDAWKTALMSHVPSVFTPIPPAPFSEVAEAYAKVLERSC